MARLQRTSSQRPQPAGAPGRGHRLDAVVLVVPFLGVIAYHVLGRPRLPAWLRAAVVGGGLAAYLVVLGVGASWVGSPEPGGRRDRLDDTCLIGTPIEG